MFSAKTLLVVGAGASKEVGLPVGSELASGIANLLTFRFEFGSLAHGDATFFQALRRHFPDSDTLNNHLSAAAQIRKGVSLVNSIDNYIDTHRNDPRIALCGKAAIVYSILEAEQNSLLRERDIADGRPNVSLNDLNKTWFMAFGRLLVDQISTTDLDRVFSNLTIICFNYDRCIEQFLSHWLAAVYAVDLSRAQEIVEKLTILRPYGAVGALAKGIRFGRDCSQLNVCAMSADIKTYTERVENEDLLRTMRTAMASAETIVFLGFAFHPLNIQLIRPTKSTKAKRVFASAYGFSKTDAEDIRAELEAILRVKERSATVPPPLIYVREDLTCAGIFSEFKRGLTGKR